MLQLLLQDRRLSRAETATPCAAMRMCAQARQTIVLPLVQPRIDRIGVTRFEQSVPRHPMRAVTGGYLQDGGAALTHIGLRRMVSLFLQLLCLLACQLYRSAWHRELLRGGMP